MLIKVTIPNYVRMGFASCNRIFIYDMVSIMSSGEKRHASMSFAAAVDHREMQPCGTWVLPDITKVQNSTLKLHMCLGGAHSFVMFLVHVRGEERSRAHISQLFNSGSRLSNLVKLYPPRPWTSCSLIPGRVLGQRPSGGPEGGAPGSSGVLPILNALGELSWAFNNTLLISIFMTKRDTDYRLCGEK